MPEGWSPVLIKKKYNGSPDTFDEIRVAYYTNPFNAFKDCFENFFMIGEDLETILLPDEIAWWAYLPVFN
jgi:hypothetical protein